VASSPRAEEGTPRAGSTRVDRAPIALCPASCGPDTNPRHCLACQVIEVAPRHARCQGNLSQQGLGHTTRHTGVAPYENDFAYYQLDLTDWAGLGDLDAVWRPATRPPKFISGLDAPSIFGRHHRIILALWLTRLASIERRGGADVALKSHSRRHWFSEPVIGSDRGASVFSKVASQCTRKRPRYQRAAAKLRMVVLNRW